MKNGTVIGHLPQKVSRVCSLFLRKGGTIDCVVTGTRKYSADLPHMDWKFHVNYYSLPKHVKLISCTPYSSNVCNYRGNISTIILLYY